LLEEERLSRLGERRCLHAVPLLLSRPGKPGCLVPAREGWAWRSFEAAEFAALIRGDWFKHPHLLEPIGGLAPAEAEERYDAVCGKPAIAA